MENLERKFKQNFLQPRNTFGSLLLGYMKRQTNIRLLSYSTIVVNNK